MVETERRKDTARELGRMHEQIRSLEKTIESMSAKIDEFTAIKHKVSGAVILIRILGAVIVAGLSALAYVMHQLEKLLQ